MATKTLPNEIMGILRQFGVADEDSSKASITQPKELEFKLTTRLISFLFGQTRYYIIFDNTADDNKHTVIEHVQAVVPHIEGHLVKNPHDETTTYGLRYKFKEVYLYKVISPKTRLDVELSNRYPDLSRSTIQKYIKAGHVRVNDQVVTQPKFDVIEADIIAMVPPDAIDHSEQTIPILYIDDNVIVINKPIGVLTHSKGALNDEFTVADFFRRYTTNGLETSRPGIVHRLDRDTSGVIIGARNDETALLLKKQFADRTTKKHYTAVIDGIPKLPEAIIDLPIGRNPSSPSMFRVDPSGKAAITKYEVLDSDDKQAVVALHPKTGRTHQLRVHMAYIASPIAGDRIYGSVKTAPRLMLHANSLELTIPTSTRKTFEAALPKEFSNRFPGLSRD